MIFVRLAFLSLWNRRLTSFLTVLSLCFSVALLLAVERTKRAAEEGFTQSISQTSLIVGAPTGPINLVLYTIFNMGSATSNISMESFNHFAQHRAVDWVIPISLGDGHRGFRVVGTNSSFYQHYRFRGNSSIEMEKGRQPDGLWDVVLGSEVAEKLQYQLGQKIVVTHGVTKGLGILNHEDKPFSVVGILRPTGTALDRSLYLSLEAIEALHVDWQNGAQPSKNRMVPAAGIRKEDLTPRAITAFFLRTKSPIDTLGLMREINDYKQESMLAIMPGVTLGELWRGLGYVEQILRMISILVVAVGLVAMLIALLTGLNERRREMAILRALGTSPWRIAGLLVFESTLLTLLGVAAGVALQVSSFSVLKSWLEEAFGIYLVGSSLSGSAWIYLGITLALGVLIGVVPAWSATRTALKDGLSVRV